MDRLTGEGDDDANSQLGGAAGALPAGVIEWRIQRAAHGRRSDTIYARVVPYVTARAIQHRLDAVCGIPG